MASGAERRGPGPAFDLAARAQPTAELRNGSSSVGLPALRASWRFVSDRRLICQTALAITCAALAVSLAGCKVAKAGGCLAKSVRLTASTIGDEPFSIGQLFLRVQDGAPKCKVKPNAGFEPGLPFYLRHTKSGLYVVPQAGQAVDQGGLTLNRVGRGKPANMYHIEAPGTGLYGDGPFRLVSDDTALRVSGPHGGMPTEGHKAVFRHPKADDSPIATALILQREDDKAQDGRFYIHHVAKGRDGYFCPEGNEPPSPGKPLVLSGVIHKNCKFTIMPAFGPAFGKKKSEYPIGGFLFHNETRMYVSVEGDDPSKERTFVWKEMPGQKDKNGKIKKIDYMHDGAKLEPKAILNFVDIIGTGFMNLQLVEHENFVNGRDEKVVVPPAGDQGHLLFNLKPVPQEGGRGQLVYQWTTSNGLVLQTNGEEGDEVFFGKDPGGDASHFTVEHGGFSSTLECSEDMCLTGYHWESGKTGASLILDGISGYMGGWFPMNLAVGAGLLGHVTGEVRCVIPHACVAESETSPSVWIPMHSLSDASTRIAHTLKVEGFPFDGQCDKEKAQVALSRLLHIPKNDVRVWSVKLTSGSSTEPTVTVSEFSPKEEPILGPPKRRLAVTGAGVLEVSFEAWIESRIPEWKAEGLAYNQLDAIDMNVDSAYLDTQRRTDQIKKTIKDLPDHPLDLVRAFAEVLPASATIPAASGPSKETSGSVVGSAVHYKLEPTRLQHLNVFLWTQAPKDSDLLLGAGKDAVMKTVEQWAGAPVKLKSAAAVATPSLMIAPTSNDPVMFEVLLTETMEQILGSGSPTPDIKALDYALSGALQASGGGPIVARTVVEDDPEWTVPSLTAPPLEVNPFLDADSKLYSAQHLENRRTLSSLPQILQACGAAFVLVALLMLLRPAVQCLRRVPHQRRRDMSCVASEEYERNYSALDMVEENEQVMDSGERILRPNFDVGKSDVSEEEPHVVVSEAVDLPSPRLGLPTLRCDGPGAACQATGTPFVDARDLQLEATSKSRFPGSSFTT